MYHGDLSCIGCFIVTISLMLAPMEGVIDHTMRAMLTRDNDYERCVTEFLRVTDRLLPERVFFAICPELKQGGTTPSETPVYVQILGSDPQVVAVNAKRAAELGALGIDLNFGCPAKTVNRSRGGASLLRTPRLVKDIVRAASDAVPGHIPVTAKIRLGYDHDEGLLELIEQLDQAQPTEITIHARTKAQGYRPPAHWHKIAEARHQTSIPIIANGEIWSIEDALACSEASGCQRLMIARGALMRPELARLIHQRCQGLPETPLNWSEIALRLCLFFEQQGLHYDAKYTPSPVEQWLVYLKHYHAPAARLFEQLKRITDPQHFGEALRAHYRST